MGTKEKIIATTTDLLFEKGFHGTRIDEITERSKISKGSIYYYFPKGKKELCIESLKLHTMQLSLNYKGLFNNSENLKGGLDKIIDNCDIELNKSNFRKGSLLVNISQEINSHQKDLQNICKDLFELIIHTFESFFLIHKIIDWQKNARVFVFKLNGAIVLSKACRNTIFLNDLKNEYS